MFRLRSHPLWIWLVIAAVWVGRFDGAHLHLCFDGQEAPAALHMADASNHDDAHHLDSEHVDQDVSLSDATWLKKTGIDTDTTLAVLATLLFVLPAVLAQRTSPAPLIHPQLRRLLYFDPPPRGPPL